MTLLRFVSQIFNLVGTVKNALQTKALLTLNCISTLRKIDVCDYFTINNGQNVKRFVNGFWLDSVDGSHNPFV
ncbi:MAG: hypothetical protein F6K58_17375 [Symploca sp. SIO2E9]|nr:hypothetical protein [Symploca sp. SIO2E9]